LLKRLYQNGKIAARALRFAVTALLALALAVGANSGILSLSEFTHTRSSIFCAERGPVAARHHELIRDAGPETLPDPNKQQAQSEQSEQVKGCASGDFDLRLGKTLFNRRVWTGKF
jgi:hypothetical protein